MKRATLETIRTDLTSAIKESNLAKIKALLAQLPTGTTPEDGEVFRYCASEIKDALLIVVNAAGDEIAKILQERLDGKTTRMNPDFRKIFSIITSNYGLRAALATTENGMGNFIAICRIDPDIRIEEVKAMTSDKRFTDSRVEALEQQFDQLTAPNLVELALFVSRDLRHNETLTNPRILAILRDGAASKDPATRINAFRTILNINLKMKFVSDLMVSDMDMLRNLMEGAKSEDIDIKQLSLRIILILSVEDNHHQQLIDAGILDILVKEIRCADKKTRIYALTTAGKMFRNEACYQVLSTAGILHLSLEGILSEDSEIKSCAFNVIAEMCYDRFSCTQLFEAGVLPILLEGARSEDSEIKSCAIVAIANMCLEKSGLQKLFEIGGLPIFLEGARSENPEIKRVCFLIIFLNTQAVEHQASLIEAGILSVLAKGVKDQDLQIKKYCFGAIANLSRNQSCHEDLVNAEVLAVIPEAIRVVDLETRKNAFTTIVNMASDRRLHENLTDAQILPCFAEIFSSAQFVESFLPRLVLDSETSSKYRTSLVKFITDHPELIGLLIAATPKVSPLSESTLASLIKLLCASEIGRDRLVSDKAILSQLLSNIVKSITEGENAARNRQILYWPQVARFLDLALKNGADADKVAVIRTIIIATAQNRDEATILFGAVGSVSEQLTLLIDADEEDSPLATVATRFFLEALEQRVHPGLNFTETANCCATELAPAIRLSLTSRPFREAINYRSEAAFRGCINHPLGAIAEICGLAAVAHAVSIEEKLEAGRWLFALKCIQAEMETLRAGSRTMPAGFEAEASNYFAFLVADKLTKERVSCPGAPKAVPHSAAITGLITETMVKNIVDETLKANSQDLSLLFSTIFSLTAVFPTEVSELIKKFDERAQLILAVFETKDDANPEASLQRIKEGLPPEAVAEVDKLAQLPVRDLEDLLSKCGKAGKEQYVFETLHERLKAAMGESPSTIPNVAGNSATPLMPGRGLEENPTP